LIQLLNNIFEVQSPTASILVIELTPGKKAEKQKREKAWSPDTFR